MSLLDSNRVSLQMPIIYPRHITTKGFMEVTTNYIRIERILSSQIIFLPPPKSFLETLLTFSLHCTLRVVLYLAADSRQSAPHHQYYSNTLHGSLIPCPGRQEREFECPGETVAHVPGQFLSFAHTTCLVLLVWPNVRPKLP